MILTVLSLSLIKEMNVNQVICTIIKYRSMVKTYFFLRDGFFKVSVVNKPVNDRFEIVRL